MVMSALVRVGECNGCLGAASCCKFVLLAVHHAYLEPDKRHWLEIHGVRLHESGGLVWARIDATCMHLTDGGKCGVFGTAERPQTCADFPFVQSDINLVDEWAGEKVCSYSFQEGI